MLARVGSVQLVSSGVCTWLGPTPGNLFPVTVLQGKPHLPTRSTRVDSETALNSEHSLAKAFPVERKMIKMCTMYISVCNGCSAAHVHRRCFAAPTQTGRLSVVHGIKRFTQRQVIRTLVSREVTPRPLQY